MELASEVFSQTAYQQKDSDNTNGRSLHSVPSRLESTQSSIEQNYENPEISKRNVQFSNVVVYSFAREQGFSAIPDTGWCSLGMARQHFSVSRYDLHHHQLLIRLRRRRRMLSQKSRLFSMRRGNLSSGLRGRSRVGGYELPGLDRRASPGDSCRVPIFSSPPPLSPQLNTDCTTFPDFPINTMLSTLRSSTIHSTPPPPCLSPPSPRRVLANLDDSFHVSNASVYTDVLDTDSEASLDQIPAVSYAKNFRRRNRKLLPIHGSARIRLLRESGVIRLDESEREVCLDVRATRSCVGCNCGPRYPCIPGRCSCADEGIQCQVDRASFPCSCTADTCHNPNGRTEFSHEKVRLHIHDRLNKQKKERIGPLPCGDISISLASCNPTGTPPAVSSSTTDHMDHSNDRVSQSYAAESVDFCAPRQTTLYVDEHLVISPALTATSLRPVTLRNSETSDFWTVSTPDQGESTIRRVLFKDVDQDEVVELTQLTCTAKRRETCNPSVAESVSSFEVGEHPLGDPFNPIESPSTINTFSDLPTCSSVLLDVQSGSADRVSPPKFSLDPVDKTIEQSDPLPSPVTPNSRCVFKKSRPLLFRPTYYKNKGIDTCYSSDADRSGYKPSDSTERFSSFSPVPGYRLAGRFVSKSAPNSPCPDTSSSLSRLSLRRRAIPRLPVTPSRRAPRSPRTPVLCNKINQSTTSSKSVLGYVELATLTVCSPSAQQQTECLSASPPLGQQFDSSNRMSIFSGSPCASSHSPPTATCQRSP